MEAMAISDLPGADLVERDVSDLRAGRDTKESALVSMAAPRLRALGLEVPASDECGAAHRLYDLLSDEDRPSAHGRYNALSRRVVSFARAAEHATSG